MCKYLKHIYTFLKASLISLVFGASWAATFYIFDDYAATNLQHLKNDFFFDIVVFFFSGLVGAFLFYLIMLIWGKLNAAFTKS